MKAPRIAWAIAIVAAWCTAVPADDSAPAPDGWRGIAARDEIAPGFEVERPAGSEGYHLVLKGRGNDAVDGRWVRTVPVSPGRYLQFRAEYRATHVATPERSVLARVVWLDSKGKRVSVPEYPFTQPDTTEGWKVVSGVYMVPPDAKNAELELHLRWAPQATVVWRRAELAPAEAPSARKVRLATINHRPRQSKSPQDNLEQFGRLIDEAAAAKADIVCLPEGITIVGTPLKYADVAEPIPGPSTRFLGECARRGKVYLVAGLIEREGKVDYNTSVLIGRDGQLLGKYRKVCLPREEIEGGLTPGKEYPVFDTDFGRVGMMICWDVHFPEVARELAARGAEVILMPIWGGNETLARARAIENQVYLVASGYDFKTAIFDPTGQPVASTTSDPDVLVTEVDLAQRVLWPWLGDFRARIWREGPARPAAER